MTEVIARLRESGTALAAVLAEVSDAQWTWREADGRWTVQEIVEHLIRVEGGIPILLRRTMSAPPIVRTEPLTDAELWGRLTGPASRKSTAPETVQPAGRWPERAEALAAIARLREANILYADSGEPFRDRWFRLPIGEVDGVQAFLMLAGHMVRHTDQIRTLLRRRGESAGPAA